MNNKIYIAICYHQGCSQCLAGCHILGAFVTKGQAEKICKEHEQNRKNHYHYFYTDIIEQELIEVGKGGDYAVSEDCVNR